MQYDIMPFKNQGGYKFNGKSYLNTDTTQVNFLKWQKHGQNGKFDLNQRCQFIVGMSVVNSQDICKFDC